MVLNAQTQRPALVPETLSYAQAAVRAVQREMDADPRVVVLGEDVGRGGIFGQYAGLQQQFGAARVIDTPISEAAIMGAGVGMALAGMRPIVEMRVVDFALCGMDEIVNQAAKNRFMFGGQGRVPLVARMPGGIWDASAAQHSQSLESWFAHLPGLVVVCPSTPQDKLFAAAFGPSVGRSGGLHRAQDALGQSGHRRRGAADPARPGRGAPTRLGADDGELEPPGAAVRAGLRRIGGRGH
jgi:pyruvate/2-oxoglutarate/acetoin dehydrogenase E1 component